MEIGQYDPKGHMQAYWYPKDAKLDQDRRRVVIRGGKNTCMVVYQHEAATLAESIETLINTVGTTPPNRKGVTP